MCWIAKIAAKFVVSLIVMSIVCTMVWQEFVTDKVYNCTDDGWLAYLRAGGWVHNAIVVHQVVAGRSMTEPDTIRDGWSTTGLWCLWYSLVVSLWLALVPWIPSRRIHQ